MEFFVFTLFIIIVLIVMDTWDLPRDFSLFKFKKISKEEEKRRRRSERYYWALIFLVGGIVMLVTGLAQAEFWDKALGLAGGGLLIIAAIWNIRKHNLLEEDN